MTEQHPLTDKIIVELIGDRNLFLCLTEDDMRAAYDRGFEDAIEFIQQMGLAPHGALAEAQEAFYNKEDN